MAERIEPYDSEHAERAFVPSWVDRLTIINQPHPHALEALLEAGLSADGHLRAIEIHANAIRARITEIADDVVLRDELNRI